jgi:hypothetical protein
VKVALSQLDRLLRGDATRGDDVRAGRLDLSIGGLLLAIVLLGIIYGVCMGSFGVVGGRFSTWPQILASAVKVPALFLCTLVVTFPSLYVFNALVGSRLDLLNMLRLILGAIAVMLAVLAGFGTIVAFFNFTSTSYAFIKLLNVVVFTVAGVLGLGFLLQTLRRLSGEQEQPEPPPVIEATLPDVPGEPPRSPEPGPLRRVQAGRTTPPVRTVFNVWVIVFALVGSQMSWLLRPFIGHPDLPFALFRPRESNFFESVLHALGQLLGIS